MNPDNKQLNPFQQIVAFIARTVNPVITLAPNPSKDAIAAAVALHKSLAKLGKSPSIACAQPIDPQLLQGIPLRHELSSDGNTLVVTFPYSDGNVEKVDYQINGNIFNLIIQPREGQPRLDTTDVKYSYSGGTVDCIILLDCPNIQTLGELYSAQQELFDRPRLVNIDRHLTNTNYGAVNYVVKTASSVSELVFDIVRSLHVEFDRDITGALYAGITAATNNFTSPSTNAETFETVAELKRLANPKAPTPPVPMKQPDAYPEMPPVMNDPVPVPINQPTPQPTAPVSVMKSPAQPQTARSQPPSNNPPATKKSDQQQKNVQNTQATEATTNNNQQETQNPEESPQDWLKPKIFSGGNSGIV